MKFDKSVFRIYDVQWRIIKDICEIKVFFKQTSVSHCKLNHVSVVVPQGPKTENISGLQKCQPPYGVVLELKLLHIVAGHH